MHKCIPYIAAQESTAPGRDPIKAVILSNPSERQRSVSDEGVRTKENTGHRNSQTDWYSAFFDFNLQILLMYI